MEYLGAFFSHTAHLATVSKHQGLRTPNEAFLHRNPKLLGLGRQFEQIYVGAFGAIFSQFISTHFGTVSPLSMFSINQPLILQKLSLYIQIPNIYLGFEFGPQRIRDLAIVCP